AAAAFAALHSAGCKRHPQDQASAPSSSTPPPGKAEQLVERVYQHNTGAAMVGAAYIGDKLGLFKSMAGAGPLTADQLAARTGFAPRYVLEWLRAMASSGYVEYQAAAAAFLLPPEHASVLVDEKSPVFAGGVSQGTVADIMMTTRVMAAFRTGKGIPYGDYPPDTFESIERSSRPEFLHQIAQQWIPAIAGMTERLQAGGAAADLGSGAGHASIAIARAFPKVRAVGFEPYAPSVVRARRNAKEAGLDDRVRFDTFDGLHVPGGPYQLITVNYALHHAGDPAGLLRSARGALAPGGAVLVAEYRRSERLEEDINTIRQLCYAYGLLECLPSALAEGGPGFGTGMTESDARRLAQQAGFSQFTRVLPDDPIRSFFVLRG
ncbi:MAG: class I SAM-dependent methyltransferase, partial [Acidobacteria bacterium]|nr:class I SAM-dependent methyltransferase [Acidobacteriota bacterium]